MSDSFGPHGLYPAKLLCPWNFPGKNTRVGCHFHPELTENARELELVRQVGSIIALVKILVLTCLPLAIHGFLDFHEIWPTK